jgi:hypothetical protein
MFLYRPLSTGLLYRKTLQFRAEAQLWNPVVRLHLNAPHLSLLPGERLEPRRAASPECAAFVAFSR